MPRPQVCVTITVAATVCEGRSVQSWDSKGGVREAQEALVVTVTVALVATDPRDKQPRPGRTLS